MKNWFISKAGILKTVIVCGLLAFSCSAFAQEGGTPAAPTIEQRLAELEAAKTTGNNAWMLTSSALVLFMSVPGIALFYGGIVRKKNVLSVFAQTFGIAGVAAILWWAIGYTMAFGPDGNAIIGGWSNAFFNGIEGEGLIFALFQFTFAVITPCLIIGAIAERMKFSAVLLFISAWLVVVYFPFAHMVWGGGFLAEHVRAIDFAGGTVVHMTSGFSALVLCIILGKRKGYGKENFSPHSVVLTAVGACILWVGWYGFNAGSAGAADGIAANAFATTTFAAAIAGFVWALAEWVFKGKPSVLGFSSGVIGGLVAITPAAGFVSVNASIVFGVLGGLIPFFAVAYMKKALGYDDALDTFGVHGVGGTLGAILTGIFANPKVNPLVEKLQSEGVNILAEQIKAVIITAVWSVVATVILAYIVKALVGLRVSPEVEQTGLDTSEHGEEGYIG
ncbi:ammonium transporter [Opitutaceae bacterium TAV4]|nr:ammonium transporter [Opitutaceae bacterium TAV4]RRK01773.1 ammonium transporter [Opitutaceae bacterium TAV3]